MYYLCTQKQTTLEYIELNKRCPTSNNISSCKRVITQQNDVQTQFKLCHKNNQLRFLCSYPPSR